MRFNYKNKVYELAELTEPNKNETFDIIAIFEIKPCKWDGTGTNLVECSNDECEYEKLNFVDYYYGVSNDPDTLISFAKRRIDMKVN